MIYDRYNGPLLRIAQRMLGRLQDAEDAVQETFSALPEHRRPRRGARFSTYLFQILNNTCIDAIRRRKNTDGNPADAETIGTASFHELSHSLAEAVDSLPEQMKACFVLFAVEQFSQEEAAEILGVSVGTVKTSVHRARKKLRAWLAVRPAGGTQ